MRGALRPVTLRSMTAGIEGMILCSAVAVAVAEARGRAGDEQRGVEAAADGDRVVPDGVDAAVDEPQTAGADAVLDLAGGEPEPQQLQASDRPPCRLATRAIRSSVAR